MDFFSFRVGRVYDVENLDMQGRCDLMECREEVIHRKEKYDIIADLRHDTKGSFDMLKA